MKAYYYGACLYPELWSEEVMRQDLAHMKQIKMNFVRFGEFIWKQLEPEENVYDMTFLEKNLSLFQEYGMKVVLCLPTPTPPRWMTYQHPERLVKTPDGKLMSHGSRQHLCTNNVYFRQKANQLAQKIAEVAAKYEHVIGIQLDNEFKCHTDLCVCASCEIAWHEWLQSEYGTIQAVNQAWQTRIWSEAYASFDEVVMPESTPFLHNSSLMTAYRKFTEDGITSFVKAQVTTIREVTTIPITHNSAHGFNLNNYDLFEALDFVGFDTYASSKNYPAYTLNLDMWRNMSSNPEFMLLETSTSHAGHIENYMAPHPKGFLSAEAFLNYACGGRTFNFWHFRGHTHGVEQPHSTVVTSWGEPDLSYSEVVEVGQMLEDLTPLLNNSQLIHPKVALIYSDRARRFRNTETGGSDKETYRTKMTNYYAALTKAGVMVDVIPEAHALTQYDSLLIPYLPYVSDELFEKIKSFVAKGGQCILGPQTADRTKEHAWPEENGLGQLGQLMQLSDVIQIDATHTAIHGNYAGKIEKLTDLTTFFSSDLSEQLASGQGDFVTDRSYFSRMSYGKGALYYLGGLSEDLSHEASPLQQYLKNLLASQFSEDLIFPEGVHVYQRQTTDGHRQYWLANLTKERKILPAELPIIYSNCENNLRGILAPFECRIVEK